MMKNEEVDKCPFCNSLNVELISDLRSMDGCNPVTLIQCIDCKRIWIDKWDVTHIKINDD